MKRAGIISMFLFIIFSLLGCSTNNVILPKYVSKECHYGQGTQDYTDFCKYYYNNESIKAFEMHNKFKIVNTSDIEDIKSYFENFNDYIKNQSYCNKYDFDYKAQIKENDYFYIVSKEGDTIGDSVYGKYDSYDVYYVDMEKCILYFIHVNT